MSALVENPDHISAIPVMTKYRDRLAYIDSLRALTAIYVVMGHISGEIWPGLYNIHPPSNMAVVLQCMMFGHYAVALFIIISGFCLMLPVLRNNMELRGGVKSFYLKRAKRILPPYYFSLGLSLLLIIFFIGHKTQTHWDCSLPITWQSIATHILLIHDFIQTGGAINHVLWSIAVEWHIYILFPILIILWRKLGPLAIVFATLMISFLVAYKLADTSYAGITAQFLGLFVLGMLAASICYGQEAMWYRIRKAPWCIISILLGLLFLRCIRHWGNSGLPNDMVMGLLGGSVLIAACNSTNIFARILDWKPLVAVGSYSYSLYLTHAPFIQLIWQYGIHPLHQSRTVEFILLAVLGMPIIIAVAYIFYLFCEKPFMNVTSTTISADKIVIKTGSK